jgi:ATP-dependent protease ClpP protease subunit
MAKNWKSYRNNSDESMEDNSPKIISLERIQDTTPQCNKIYFYSDVTKESVLSLNRQIDELNKQMKMIQFSFGLKEPPRLELHICSDGGDVYAAMSAVDKIADNPVPIDTYCEGLVGSAATLLSCVGDKRFITRNSSMLIHQVSTQLWGNYVQFTDEMKNLDLLMGMIKKIYLKKTSLGQKEMDELLKHDLVLSSEDCLKFGLVDKII